MTSVVESLPAHMRALFAEVIGAHGPVLLEVLKRHEVPSNDEGHAVETILSNEFSGEICQDFEPQRPRKARGRYARDFFVAVANYEDNCCVVRQQPIAS
jgi:hypothetical protein